MKTASRGFSLLELLIVVAFILIIATIAVPSLLRSRQVANEASAVANMRNIAQAEISFGASRGGTFGTINDLSTNGLIDNRFVAGGVVSGYTFAVTSGFATFTVHADPAGMSGRYNYSVNEDGILRYNTMVPTGFAPGEVIK